jgi:hypothetical protein
MTWIVFYDSKGKELAAYTEDGTFAGELKATADLLAFECGIPAEEIVIREEER